MPSRATKAQLRLARERRENGLLSACTDALRAWIRADREGLSPSARERLLTEARRLTGIAVDRGLFIKGRAAEGQ